MEPTVIKKGKKEYAFYSGRLVITKKDKIIREIYYHEIEKITYNPKFGIGDFFNCTFPGADSFSYSYNGFVMYLKAIAEKYSLDCIVGMQLSADEFEEVKKIIGMPVKLV